jgi:hypothetical protein
VLVEADPKAVAGYLDQRMTYSVGDSACRSSIRDLAWLLASRNSPRLFSLECRMRISWDASLGPNSGKLRSENTVGKNREFKRGRDSFRPVTTLWTRWLAAPPGLEVVMMRPDSFHPELVAALGWIKTRNGFPASSSIPRIGHSFSGLSSGHVR